MLLGHIHEPELVMPARCITLDSAVHCRFYWGCDPISYAQRALAINEFSAPRWQNLKTPTGESVGNTVLDQRGIPHEQWWIWCASICASVSCMPPAGSGALGLL